MKIKLDENLSRLLKSVLTELGHHVATAADENLTGKPDSEVAKAAREEGMMIFTLDIGFADLRKFPPGSHPGVVLFRPGSMGPLTVNRFVEEFARNTDLAILAGCVAVVDPGRIRVRRPE